MNLCSFSIKLFIYFDIRRKITNWASFVIPGNDLRRVGKRIPDNVVFGLACRAPGGGILAWHSQNLLRFIYYPIRAIFRAPIFIASHSLSSPWRRSLDVEATTVGHSEPGGISLVRSGSVRRVFGSFPLRQRVFARQDVAREPAMLSREAKVCLGVSYINHLEWRKLLPFQRNILAAAAMRLWG